MRLKKKVKKAISKKQKKSKKSFFAPAPKLAVATGPVTEQNAFWSERVPLFAALFLFAFGMGLITDGKKIYNQQLKFSQRVDYKATLNPYSTN